jgi:hypothetical protein
MSFAHDDSLLKAQGFGPVYAQDTTERVGKTGAVNETFSFGQSFALFVAGGRFCA